jgi:preprotein translocase subunit SecA
MTRFNFPEDQPLAHGLVSRVLEQAQVKVEGFNFEVRKNLLDYDDVLNKQREIIYKDRQKIVLDREDALVSVMEKVRVAIENMVQVNLFAEGNADSKKMIVDEFATIIPFDDHSKGHLYKQMEQYQSAEKVTEFLTGVASQLLKNWEKEFGREQLSRVYKMISLSSIDNLWMEHLTAMEDLRTGIGLRGYGQRDPLIEYKNESFNMFERLVGSVDDEIAHRVFRINLAQMAPQIVAQDAAPVRANVTTNTPESEIGGDAAKEKKEKAKPKKIVTASDGSTKKLGRNDPCWCGSGKKWKKCHYPNLPA